MTSQKHIIVVGAGIVGASIAWHLAKAGAKVTVVEAGSPGGVATPASFAWINATWGNPEGYFHFRRRSMREWARLVSEVPGIPLAWTGSLCWDLPPSERDAFETLHSGWGYGIRRVDRDEASRIEPNVRDLPETALFVAEEGAVEPVTAALALLKDAERLGARLVSEEPARSLRVAGGRVAGVETGSSMIEADDVVLAAGIATPALAATAGVAVELDTPPGLIVHSRPHELLLTGLVMGDALHMRQTAEGRIIAGVDFGGGAPGEDPEYTARELFARLKTVLRGGEKLDLDFHTVGLRPTPKDGFPIASRAEAVDGFYVAVMHSGVTLAPVIGLLVADELLSGGRHELLSPYALSRFSP